MSCPGVIPVGYKLGGKPSMTQSHLARPGKEAVHWGEIIAHG